MKSTHHHQQILMRKWIVCCPYKEMDDERMEEGRKEGRKEGIDHHHKHPTTLFLFIYLFFLGNKT